MKPTSYWLDTSQPFDRGSSKPLEGRYDVAVVGGGMTGSSAALALAKKGARVALLEGAANLLRAFDGWLRIRLGEKDQRHAVARRQRNEALFRLRAVFIRLPHDLLEAA